MQLPNRKLSALIPAALFLLVGTAGVVQGDNISEADGHGQSTGKQAEAKVAQLITQVAGSLTKSLNSSFSLYENWFDPFIGLRGRYNLTKALQLTAETDVGGFGIGSEITWNTYGALGLQITRNIYSEIGYRYLYLDYDTTSFIFQAAMHGAQITAGITF